ncbi:hypothetical protein HMPREF1624_06366 [Sporothrix schenckii ATCC 58251]|uniref:Uncharacterized protein n=1 Tax=Sporothrix schenckii (strain ATCC 58251 / de Perez 2211183) TaxID=1391915 RepID=U7PN33_SPOS1|nr:hypothetical protein HMPREF1624_06366 [Sporothrix schenckii ATCC 58251]
MAFFAGTAGFPDRLPNLANPAERRPPPPNDGSENWHAHLQLHFTQIFHDMDSRELFTHFAHPQFYIPPQMGEDDEGEDGEDGETIDDIEEGDMAELADLALAYTDADSVYDENRGWTPESIAAVADEYNAETFGLASGEDDEEDEDEEGDEEEEEEQDDDEGDEDDRDLYDVEHDHMQIGYDVRYRYDSDDADEEEHRAGLSPLELARYEVERAREALHDALLLQRRKRAYFSRRRCVRMKYDNQPQTKADAPYAFAYVSTLHMEVYVRLLRFADQLDDPSVPVAPIVHDMTPYTYDEEAEMYGAFYKPPMPEEEYDRYDGNNAEDPVVVPPRVDVPEYGPPPAYLPSHDMLAPDIMRRLTSLDYVMHNHRRMRLPLMDPDAEWCEFDPPPPYAGKPDDDNVAPPAYYRTVDECCIEPGPLHASIRREFEALRTPEPWTVDRGVLQLRLDLMVEAFERYHYGPDEEEYD